MVYQNCKSRSVRVLLSYASPRWFPFLSVTNITKLERLHRAASRVIIGCFSTSPISYHFSSVRLLYLSYKSSLLISPCSLMSRHFIFQPPIPFHVWPDKEWNQDSADHPGELLHPLTRSCSLLVLLGKPSLLALNHRFGTYFPSLWSPPFPPCSRSDPLLSHQGAAYAHLDSLPTHDLVI